SPRSPPFPYTTLFRSGAGNDKGAIHLGAYWLPTLNGLVRAPLDTAPPVPPAIELLDVNGRRPGSGDMHLDAGERELTIQFRSIRSEEHTSELQSREKL